ncbi:MAG: EthD family reductase [Chloroflexi bacterium]|nr:EthD family reductase [Chloroflexota bacterium]
MIRVSVFYPNTPDGKFDIDYYAGKHMSMVTARLKPMGMLRWEIDKGLASGAPGTPAPFIAVGHLYFSSVEEFEKAFGTHGPELMADVPNFTDIEPQIQISEVIS